MKNYYSLIVIATILFLTSCEKTDSERDDLNPKPDLEVIDGMLSFKDQVTFDETVDYLLKMGYNYSLNWCDSLGFSSMNNFYDEAFEESENLTTLEEYLNFKEKYSVSLLFNDTNEEDFSFYLPLTETKYASLINIYGEVRIGDNEYNLIDLETIDDEYLDRTFHRKSTEGTTCYTITVDNRRFWSFLYSTPSLVCQEVHAQKKFLWGWIDYKTSYGIVVKSRTGWTSHHVIGEIYNTGDIPSPSYLTIGYKASGASYYYGSFDQWSRGIGYDNRCTYGSISGYW